MYALKIPCESQGNEIIYTQLHCVLEALRHVPWYELEARTIKKNIIRGKRTLHRYQSLPRFVYSRVSSMCSPRKQR